MPGILLKFYSSLLSFNHSTLLFRFKLRVSGGLVVFSILFNLISSITCERYLDMMNSKPYWWSSSASRSSVFSCWSFFSLWLKSICSGLRSIRGSWSWFLMLSSFLLRSWALNRILSILFSKLLPPSISSGLYCKVASCDRRLQVATLFWLQILLCMHKFKQTRHMRQTKRSFMWGSQLC